MNTASDRLRPRRWDIPYCQEIGGDEALPMSESTIERLLSEPPLNRLEPNDFPSHLSLQNIIRNDARLVRYTPGDIIVRRGDWGNSMFQILSGTVRVELEPDTHPIPVVEQGKSKQQKKTFWETLSLLWKNHTNPEVRTASHVLSSQIHTRGLGTNTRIYLPDVGVVLDQYRTARMTAPQSFGELAALGRTPRQATVFAETDVELLEIRWQGLRELLTYDRTKAWKTEIDNTFRERGLRAFLRNAPMFSHLDDNQMSQLVAEAEFADFGRFDEGGASFKTLVKKGKLAGLEHEPLIANEGDHPNGVILIRSGIARLSRQYHHGHRTIGYLLPGQAYGFEEIVDGWKTDHPSELKSSLRSIGYVTTVIVPTRLVENFVLNPFLDKNESHDNWPTEFNRIASTQNGPAVDSALLEFLTERHLVHGSATMMIDLNRCTRCDDCVRACATAHDGNSRFVRNGPVHENYLVANACMHCEDPLCMVQCPTGAIQRDMQDGLVLINDPTCIGCGACAAHCPYDAIRIVPVRNEQGDFLPAWYQDDERPQNSGYHLIEKATKCDLCFDQMNGPACQNACPHDALVRIDLRQVNQLSKYANR